jgi:RHS repeat-associated protein
MTNKVDALNAEMFRYKYDPEGQLTNRWQAGGITTTYRFDEMGNLTNVVYSGGPATSEIKLRYDLVNRLTNMIDGIGTTAFTWTPGGQLASEDGPWSSDAVSYSYSHRLRSGLSLQQVSASPWQQSYGYDAYRRLTNVTSQAGAFRTQYKASFWGTNTASELVEQLNLPGGSHIDNSHDAIGRLLSTVLKNATNGTLNAHSYVYNDGHQRTKQTFLEGNYVDYGYDNIGQLKTAKGWESGGSAARSHEQFGYAYDAAWNLNYRTNNALAQSFGVNGLNQLTNLTRSGTYTVAGAVSLTPTNLTLKDNANAAQAATVYGDLSFARTNVTLLNGANTFVAVAQDSLGRTDTNTVTAYLPASAVCAYDSRGNLTNDGRRVFFYDSENQLTNVHVVGAWKSEFGYDGLMRRKVRKEFTWSGSAWVQTNEVRYIYDGRLVIQERHYTPQGSTLISLNTVTYTRGNDLSGSFEGAGGIGGLLARSDNLLFVIGAPSATAIYHADGNGNVTAMVSTNGQIAARYSYEPYGNALAMSGPLAEANLYRFSSKEHHPNSGLVYYLYRYYDSGLQRWINRDPIAEEGGLNLYAFVFSDTISSLDPFGLRGRTSPRAEPYVRCEPDEPGWGYRDSVYFPRQEVISHGRRGQQFGPVEYTIAPPVRMARTPGRASELLLNGLKAHEELRQYQEEQRLWEEAKRARCNISAGPAGTVRWNFGLSGPRPPELIIIQSVRGAIAPSSLTHQNSITHVSFPIPR